MTDQDYMELAIKQAKLSSEKVPCGVLIVKDGEVIAEDYNSHHPDHDATAHAEIKVVRKAGKVLGNKNLVGCSAYSTCEPCTMCASALFYAQIDKIYYGITMAEVDPDNTRIMLTIEELADKITEPPTIKGGTLREECIQELYKEII